MLAKEINFIERFKARARTQPGAEPVRSLEKINRVEPPRAPPIVEFELCRPALLRRGEPEGMQKGYGTGASTRAGFLGGAQGRWCSGINGAGNPRAETGGAHAATMHWRCGSVKMGISRSTPWICWRRRTVFESLRTRSRNRAGLAARWPLFRVLLRHWKECRVLFGVKARLVMAKCCSDPKLPVLDEPQTF